MGEEHAKIVHNRALAAEMSALNVLIIEFGLSVRGTGTIVNEDTWVKSSYFVSSTLVAT